MQRAVSKPRLAPRRIGGAGAARPPAAAAASSRIGVPWPAGSPSATCNGRVEDRNARLERVRHARAVGLDEHVVDEEESKVEVHEAAPPPAPALSLYRPRRRARSGSPFPRRIGETPPGFGRQDALPLVVPVERRQAGGARETLQLPVERACAGASTSAASRRAGVMPRPRSRAEARGHGRRSSCSRRTARLHPPRRARP